MGTCHPDSISEDIQTESIATGSKHQLRQEQLQSLLEQLSPPIDCYQCQGGNEIKHACLSTSCSSSSFHCGKSQCPCCLALHMKCQTVQIQQLASLFAERAVLQKNFILGIQKQEQAIFDQIEEQRNEIIRRFVQKQKEDHYLNVFPQGLSNKASPNLEGRQVKSVFDRLKEVKKQTEHLGKDLLSEFQRETQKLGKYFIEVEKNTINCLSNIKISPFEHPRNPHNDRFRMIAEPKKVKISLKYQDQHWYNFVKNGRIPSNFVTSFFIKQLKTNQYSIMTGICTQNVLGKKDTYNHPEVVTYVSGDGYVCENGMERKAGRSVKDGQTIIVGVDTINWRVGWGVGVEKLADAQIPEALRKQDLFLTIMMYNLNDEAEILMK